MSTPQWLTDSMAAMKAKYPDDIFEAVIRKNAGSGAYEFRIKCLDCPGKVCLHCLDLLSPKKLTPCPALHSWA